MKKYLRRNIIFLFICWISSGCASKPHSPIDQGWQQPDETLGIIYVPPPKEIYVEIARGARRYAEFEAKLGQRLLASVASSGLGAWTGYSWAVASAPSGAIVVVNPYAMAAVVLAGPIVEATVEAAKQSSAKRRAKPFQEFLTAENGHQLFAQALEAQMVPKNNLGFGNYDLAIATDERFDNIDEQAYLDQFDADRFLVIGSVAAFTPRFEVLEVSVVYGVLERTEDGFSTIYDNAVVVQSRLRSGLEGADTRNEIQEIIKTEKQRKLDRLNERIKSRRPAQHEIIISKNKILKDAERKGREWESEYHPFDDRDSQGSRWLADSGIALETELAACYAEAARLIVNDLQLSAEALASSKTTPPGYKVEMLREASFDSDERDVYRLKTGQLVSIDRTSRMVPLSSDS